MEGHFEIQLLGPPQLRWQERPFALSRRQARALLFRLAAESQPIPREKLADLLWSETSPAKARRNLTRLLSYLRGQFPHPDLLQTGGTTVSLNHGMVRSDAVLFSELCRSDDHEAWQSAVSLYRGPFLSGFILDESREFESWQSLMGRHFEELYLKTLRRLILGGSDGPAQAIGYAGLYLAVDDLAEDIHRQLITLYAQTGDRAAALRQYEECVFVLERELGVEPLPETRAAYEAARDGRLPALRGTNNHVLSCHKAQAQSYSNRCYRCITAGSRRYRPSRRRHNDGRSDFRDGSGFSTRQLHCNRHLVGLRHAGRLRHRRQK